MKDTRRVSITLKMIKILKYLRDEGNSLLDGIN